MSNPKLVIHTQPLFKSPELNIYYDTLYDWIYMDWIGEQTVESIKLGCKQLLKFIQSERCPKVLNDNTKVTNIWSDTAAWIAVEFLPQAEKAGLAYLAWIYSPDHFSRLSADEVIGRHQTSIVTIPFNSYEEAKNWLTSF